MKPVLCLLTLLLATSLQAQIDRGLGHEIICVTQDSAADATQLPAPAILNGSAQLRAAFVYDFSEDVPEEARTAFQFAGDVWGAYLDSDVDINIQVDWEDRMDDRLLASAGPGTLFRDFPNGVPDTWYPVALAEALVGRELNDTDDPDIRINANSTANWYFGTDAATPRGRVDLVSVILHELGHGLGFLSSVDTIGTEELEIGFGGRFIIYDRFLETEQGVPLIDENMFGNPSNELLSAVSRDNLFFDGIQANQANEGEVPLFAPSTFDNGSSVSHLSETLFRAGSENALMTPFLAAGEAVHDPGPITLGIFADMGWPVVLDLVNVEQAALAGIRVFPNPVGERVTIDLSAAAGTATLSLFTSEGRRVRFVDVANQSGPRTLSVADLPAGFYVLVGEGRRPWRQRLVIQ